MKCSCNYHLSNRIKAKIGGREPPTELPEEDETAEYLIWIFLNMIDHLQQILV